MKKNIFKGIIGICSISFIFFQANDAFSQRKFQIPNFSKCRKSASTYKMYLKEGQKLCAQYGGIKPGMFALSGAKARKTKRVCANKNSKFNKRYKIFYSASRAQVICNSSGNVLVGKKVTMTQANICAVPGNNRQNAYKAFLNQGIKKCGPKGYVSGQFSLSNVKLKSTGGSCGGAKKQLVYTARAVLGCKK